MDSHQRQQRKTITGVILPRISGPLTGNGMHHRHVYQVRHLVSCRNHLSHKHRSKYKNRGGSEPPPFPSSSSSGSVSGRPPATQSSSTHPHSATQKRRAKSPTASVSKKAKTKPSLSRSKVDDERNRRSVANYPEPPTGDNMMDAIPSWTQPVPAGGNWDEVSVLNI